MPRKKKVEVKPQKNFALLMISITLLALCSAYMLTFAILHIVGVMQPTAMDYGWWGAGIYFGVVGLIWEKKTRVPSWQRQKK